MAFAGTQYEVLADELDGPTAVAFGINDETSAAKVIADTKKKAEALEFKAGVVDGTKYDAKGLEVLATIPSKDVLISKLLGSLQSPITNIARVLKQIAEQKENPAA
jgi:large subunit ribosomal protein L10